MNIENIINILERFVDNGTSIQGAALVTSDGQLITDPPIGKWKNNESNEMAGMTTYFVNRLKEKIQYNGIKKISVEAEEGYIILGACDPYNFLLVKASPVTNVGLLTSEIRPILQELQAALKDKANSSSSNPVKSESSAQTTKKEKQISQYRGSNVDTLEGGLDYS